MHTTTGYFPPSLHSQALCSTASPAFDQNDATKDITGLRWVEYDFVVLIDDNRGQAISLSALLQGTRRSGDGNNPSFIGCKIHRSQRNRAWSRIRRSSLLLLKTLSYPPHKKTCYGCLVDQ